MKSYYKILLIVALILFCNINVSAEEINWQVISGGGAKASDAEFILTGTVGQTAIGGHIQTSDTIIHGFWQYFPIYCDECEPGEADGVPVINILDIVYIINHKYKEGPDPMPYAICSADTNCDCIVDILDIVYLINYKYKSGPSPCSCSGWAANCGLPVRK